jgi:hypothetical protein
MFLGTRFLVPDGCDLVAAGALPVAFGTSHLSLVHRAQLKAGQVSFLPCDVISFYFSNMQEGYIKKKKST